MARHMNMLWGGTNTGKTNLLKTFARGLFESTGKKTRVVSAEKAQSEGVLREGIEAGWIIPWWITELMDEQGLMQTPFERITDAVLGKWPEDVHNPHSRLIPAFSIQYRATCGNVDKHVEKQPVLVYQGEKPTANAASLKCPKCGSAVIQETVRAVTDKRLSEVGAYFFEGATEFGDLMMTNMEQRAAKGENTGGNIAVRFQDGNLWVGSNTQSHYGTAQKQIKNKIAESVHLPVDYIWWTAVMEDGKDEDKGGIMVYGPKIPGTKKTSDVPRWFGTTLSTCTVPTTVNGSQQSEYRLYLKEYYQDWIQMVAKQRCIVNNRIPAENLKGIPQFVRVDHEQKEIEVGGLRMNPKTLLWEITRLIEQRQSPVSEQIKAAPAPAASGALAANKGDK